VTDELRARIRSLERRRGQHRSMMGGAMTAVGLYSSLLDGTRAPESSAVARAVAEGFDLMAYYREKLAVKVADAALARAQAQCLTVEIRALRALANAVLDVEAA
jgi:hypothetical protein